MVHPHFSSNTTRLKTSRCVLYSSSHHRIIPPHSVPLFSIHRVPSRSPLPFAYSASSPTPPGYFSFLLCVCACLFCYAATFGKRRRRAHATTTRSLCLGRLEWVSHIVLVFNRSAPAWSLPPFRFPVLIVTTKRASLPYPFTLFVDRFPFFFSLSRPPQYCEMRIVVSPFRINIVCVRNGETTFSSRTYQAIIALTRIFPLFPVSNT